MTAATHDPQPLPNPYRRAASLHVLAGRYAIGTVAEVPTGAGMPFAVVCAEETVTVVLRQEQDLGALREVSRDWRALRVEACFDPDQAGMLAAILSPIAQANLHLFVIGAFDQDYVFVKDETLATAIEALTAAGHVVVGQEPDAAPAGTERP